MDLLQFDFSGSILGISSVLSVCAVIYWSRFLLTKLEMHP